MGTVLKDSAVVFVAVEVFRLELIDSYPPNYKIALHGGGKNLYVVLLFASAAEF